MRWHKEDRIEDGELRHPADAEAWKHIDKTFPNFAHECRNVRLGLSSDRFNPFGVMSSGKHAPGNDIDVYLEPLIDELKQLWSEAYANLSDLSTKGKRWLPSGYKYRKLSNKFDGTVETRNKPCQMTSADIVKLLEHLPKIRFVRGSGKKKKALKRKRAFQRAHVDNGVNKLPKGWSKFSIFFQLPYWQNLKIRHNLDVMHIEKNVCDNIVSTLLQDPNKSKDDLRARQDLAALNIREDLQAEDVQERKLLGLKIHDYHVLLHQFLPVALRNNMEKEASKIIMEYCGFFRKLCSKVIDVKEFKKLETEVSLILCNLELIFPPFFFTVMVHVTQHLASEAIIAGPVSYRWMYPIERYLGFMKRLVRNRAHPEGSMAEGYVTNECHTFASCYMCNRVKADQPPTKEKKLVKYPRSDLEQVDKDVLAGVIISEDNLVHAQCPYFEVRRYSEHIINGYKFKTVATDDKRVTQNSGVMGYFVQECFSSVRDQNSVEADILYYGQLEDIVEIIYGYDNLVGIDYSSPGATDSYAEPSHTIEGSWTPSSSHHTPGAELRSWTPDIPDLPLPPDSIISKTNALKYHPRALKRLDELKLMMQVRKQVAIAARDREVGQNEMQLDREDVVEASLIPNRYREAFGEFFSGVDNLPIGPWSKELMYLQ
ncbi:uncharacterized protein LOC109839045 [Asparagus officinalis]|uniref:uncharacterized protein LOC109839045 n=1 Tax=Asparagus officinalis TaxID=4686 RepID=UPI00098DFC69|nr:uncharacterized protein LOC109839045 [Asparagus officinalis]